MKLVDLIKEVELMQDETKVDRQLVVKEGDQFGLLKYYDDRLVALREIELKLAELKDK